MILGFQTWEIVTFTICFFIFFISGGTALYIWLDKIKYPFRVAILANVEGTDNYIIAGRDKARLIRFGDGGEQIYYLKKRKLYRVAYRKFIGKNYLAWALASDGYWYNVTFENLDKRLLQMGVKPTDLETRYANASIRKGIEHRFDDRTFLEKWAVPVTIGMLILAIIINGAVMYFVITKLTQANAANAETIKALKEVLDLAARIMSNVDTIKSGGSGFTPTA